MTSEERYPRRTRRKRQTRRKMIEATAKLLRQYPASGITMAQVAEAADLHVTTLFTHFDSKADLLAAMSEPQIERLEAAVAESMGSVSFFDFLKDAETALVRSGSRWTIWIGRGSL